MIRTQIQLTEEQVEAVRKIAESKRISSAEVIRLSINRMIDAIIEPDIKERRSRALKSMGRFGSGKSDVSENHDKYLAEGFLR